MDEFNNENQGVGNTSAENNDAVSETPASEPKVIDASEVEIVAAPNVNAAGNTGVNYWQDTVAANAGAPQSSSVLAIVSLIMGIISLVSALTCFCFGLGFVGSIFGIIALITGVLNMVKKKPGSGMAIAGIITGALGTLIGVAALFMIIAALAGFVDAMEEISTYSSNSYY